MTTGDRLLADILAHPDDDTPRLIYADWLDEHGDDPERAELIRLQCELATFAPVSDRVCLTITNVAINQEWDPFDCRPKVRITGTSFVPMCVCVGNFVSIKSDPPGYCANYCFLESIEPRWNGSDTRYARITAWELPEPPPTRQDVLMRRACELVYQYGFRWIMGNYSQIRLGVDTSWAQDPHSWRRGFVESVIMPGDSWVKHADAILALHPVREVTLTSDPGVGWATTFHGGARWLTLRPSIRVDADECGAAHSLHALLEKTWPGIHFVLIEQVAFAPVEHY